VIERKRSKRQTHPPDSIWWNSIATTYKEQVGHRLQNGCLMPRAKIALTLLPVAQNRSLERGVEILRAFRQGVDHLGNGEISERTGLSKATVSRLTQSLVACGLLEHDMLLRVYRLAPTVLALAHAMRIGSPVLRIATPLLRAAAEQLRVNVGLAAPDGDTMIYLEAIRSNRKGSLRNVVAGQRVPMEQTSLGRAYLAALSEGQRAEAIALIRAKRNTDQSDVEREIDAAVANVKANGSCAAAWQPGVFAVATPLILSSGPIYALNLSVASGKPASTLAGELSGPLLELHRKLSSALERLTG
jgi:DNA-binding IclR family transcriptional regulator